MISQKIQNDNKFYYAKHFIYLTMGFLFMNLIPYAMNHSNKEEIQRSLSIFRKVSDEKCFTNQLFIAQLLVQDMKKEKTNINVNEINSDNENIENALKQINNSKKLNSSSILDYFADNMTIFKIKVRKHYYSFKEE